MIRDLFAFPGVVVGIMTLACPQDGLVVSAYIASALLDLALHTSGSAYRMQVDGLCIIEPILEDSVRLAVASYESVFVQLEVCTRSVWLPGSLGVLPRR